MKILTAYLDGISMLLGQKKMWFFFYSVLLFFGLIMILPIHGMILEHLGYPLDIGRDLGVFDYTQIADLLNNHGETLSIIFYQAKWVLLFYLLVSVLLTSGLVQYIYHKEKQFSFSVFIKRALNVFWKIFRLTIYFLFFQAVLLALCLFLYRLYVGSFSPFEIEEDARLVSGFWMIVPVYLFFALALQIISDISKYHIVNSHKRYIYSSIFNGFKSFGKSFFQFSFYYILHIILIIVITKIYLLVKSAFSLESSFGFWFLIILGQFYIFLKVGMRLVKYAGLKELMAVHLNIDSRA